MKAVLYGDKDELRDFNIAQTKHKRDGNVNMRNIYEGDDIDLNQDLV